VSPLNWRALSVVLNDRAAIYAEEFPAVLADVGPAMVEAFTHFGQLVFLHGPPPKAIWVRLGNANTIEFFDALRNNHNEIVRFGEDADEALVVLP
jgi:hypothetical protein